MFHRLPAAVSSAKLFKSGGVVERSIAPVLKTGDPQGSVGSNPTPSDFRRSRVETFRWDESAAERHRPTRGRPREGWRL